MMYRILILLLLLLTTHNKHCKATPPTLDVYGGRTDINCTGTGWFHTQKLGNRWWLCDPAGHVFYAQMMNGVIPIDSTASTTVNAKYGSTIAWTTPTNNRLKSWNFNSLTTNTYIYSLPIGTDGSFPLDSFGIHSQPVKLPFTLEIRPANYAMHNTAVCASPFLTAPVKNMYGSVSSFYPNGPPSGGVADYYDSGIVTWMNGDLTMGCDFTWNTYNAATHYQNYLIGIFLDDGDQMNGFGAGPDFTTQPSGKNNAHLGMQVATLSPIQTANSTFGFVYPDTLIHSKLTLRNNLATQYTTIGALNTAWGSSYTTFDSSGTCVGTQPITCAASVSADSVGTGNGSTLTFSPTLTHTTISGHSLQILVAGAAVAGDTGSGTIYGPNASGTINYSTGALSITFTAGNAPGNGTAITATYIANGWGIGTGFLDEDNRVSHNSYMGTDWIGMSSANATVHTDLNTFLQTIAGKYFSDCRTSLKAVYPNIMILGPDSLTTWNTPSPAPVLKAAGQYLDAFVTGSTVIFSQAQMNYIESNYGDKPYIGSFYSNANADSALSQYTGNPAPTGFSTQALRAAGYSTMVTAQLRTAQTSAGNFPYIGTYYWEYFDNWAEQLNWGIVTHLDNAYNGVEPATGSVTCSAPLAAYTCGSEPIPPSGGGTPPFGNLTGSVTTTNALWLNIFTTFTCSGGPAIPAAPFGCASPVTYP